MKDVKAPTSRSYQEFLIESLRNAQEAAGYIEVTLTNTSDSFISNRVSETQTGYMVDYYFKV